MMKRPQAVWIYIGLVTVAGAWAIVRSLGTLQPWRGWGEAAVMFLAVLLEFLKVDLFTYRRTERSAVTAGVAATFLVTALYGVETAVLTALLQAVATALVHRSVWFKALFNIGLFTAATYLSGWVYLALGGADGSWEIQVVLASVTAATLYFFVQSACVSLAISLTSERPFRKVWTDSFSWMVLQQAVIGMAGLLLGRFMHGGMTLMGAVLVGSPLMLLRYSYKIYAGRTQEHIRQIEQAYADLAALNEELRVTNNELIGTLGSVLDARDRYTFGHSAQVATYSVAIGEKMGMSPAEVESLRRAALLHDIGKVGIPESILFKNGRLDEFEWRIMQAHVEIGYRIIRQVHSLSQVAEIVRQHHERWSGGGYPMNLRGEQIVLAARIISVADALDTIASDRPYRKGKPVEVAFSEIRRCAGTQFDPAVVGALEALLKERGGNWFVNTSNQIDHTLLALEVAASMHSEAQ